jgi:DNA repair protein RecO (recombination protein O)
MSNLAADADSLSEEKAFVLHRWDYRNDSLLVELWTQDRGRFPVIARGAKKRMEFWSALLQAFRPLWVMVSGRGEVRSLQKCEAYAPPVGLVRRALLCGLYVNELLLRLLPRYDPHGDLFVLYESTLYQLRHGDEPSSVLCYFELDLLQELGFGLDLGFVQDNGSPIDPAGRYRYLHETGLVLANPRDPVAMSGQTLVAMVQREPLQEPAATEARLVLRTVFDSLLGDRPLKTRELLDQ